MGRQNQYTYENRPIPRECHVKALELLLEYGGETAIARYADFAREYYGTPTGADNLTITTKWGAPIGATELKNLTRKRKNRSAHVPTVTMT